MLTAQGQVAAFILRKKSRSKRLIAALTAFRPGLVVNAGDYVQSFNMAWRAQNSGTTGATAPNNTSGNTVSDGAITWSHQAVLLTPQAVI